MMRAGGGLPARCQFARKAVQATANANRRNTAASAIRDIQVVYFDQTYAFCLGEGCMVETKRKVCYHTCLIVILVIIDQDVELSADLGLEVIHKVIHCFCRMFTV